MPKGKDSQDDIIFEEENNSSDLELKKLREKLKDCRRHKEEYLAGWQRVKADFVNARNDEEKSREEFKKFAESKLIEDILPIIDGFESAFNNENWKKIDKVWQDGIKSLYNQFISVLKEHRVEPIEAKGKEFDPQEHEAVAEVEAKEKDDNIVMEEFRKGYKIEDKIIRPAQVKVGKHKK